MIVSLALVAMNYGAITQNIVLHFDAFQGVDLFGSKANLWGVWVLGLMMMMVNGILCYEFYNRERFFSYLFIMGNVLISMLVLIIDAVLISIN